MEKYMQIMHVLPTTDKVHCVAFRREGMQSCGINNKKDCAEIFLVDFSKIGVLTPEDILFL
jgi:hypothetical protein